MSALLAATRRPAMDFAAGLATTATIWVPRIMPGPAVAAGSALLSQTCAAPDTVAIAEPLPSERFADRAERAARSADVASLPAGCWEPVAIWDATQRIVRPADAGGLALLGRWLGIASAGSLELRRQLRATRTAIGGGVVAPMLPATTRRRGATCR